MYVREGGAGFVCDNALRVKKITAGGASEAAGIPVGHVLVSFNGKSVNGTWSDVKDMCKRTAHPWIFVFTADGAPAPAPVQKASPVAGGIVVEVHEGGAGFVCTPDLTVKKVTAGGASEASGVAVGMLLGGFKAGQSSWIKRQDPDMVWAAMKELCKASPYPWQFIFYPATSAAAAPAAAPAPRPQQQAPPQQRRRQRVQEVAGHEWVDTGPNGFSVKFEFTTNDAQVAPEMEVHLMECTSDTEHLIKAEDMEAVLKATRASMVKPSDANDIVLWLANRLCEGSVNVKLKVLFVLKKFLADGSSTMQVMLRGKSKLPALKNGFDAVDGNLKAVLSYRVPPHPEHGDKPLQMLHKTCRVVQSLLVTELTTELSRARTAIDAGVRAEDAKGAAQEEEVARQAADAAYMGSVEEQKAAMSRKVKAQKAENARKLEEQRARERSSRGLGSMTCDAPASAADPLAAAAAPVAASAPEVAPVAEQGLSSSLFDDDGGLFGTDADDDVEPTNLFAAAAVFADFVVILVVAERHSSGFAPIVGRHRHRRLSPLSM